MGRPCGSLVDLAALEDSGGYVRVPRRCRGSLVGWLEFCCQFVRISAACVCVFCLMGAAMAPPPFV